MAQDVAKLSPGMVKVESDNAQMRVLRFKEPAGAKLPMHSHPAYVAIAFVDESQHYMFPDGTSKDMKAEAGSVSFSEAITHASENVGTQAGESIMIELKTKPGGEIVTGAGDMMKTDPAMTKVLLDNPWVRVLRVVVPPRGKLAMHSHPSCVVVYMVGGRTKTTMEGGKTQVSKIAPRSVRVMGPTMHANENLTDKETVAIVVELKTASM